jgi:CRP-like cAMP-binding protein
MLKLARITRIAKVIRNLNIGISQKVALKIF